MITVTPNFDAKTATLDARIAAGEQVTIRLPGADAGGLTLAIVAPGGETVAAADGVERSGGAEFDLDLNTAEAAAATAVIIQLSPAGELAAAITAGQLAALAPTAVFKP